jgi:hypothetical protein
MTRVDGYSHHKQEKLDLQVSKKEGDWNNGEWEAKGGVNLKLLHTCTFYIHMPLHIICE